MHNRPVSPYWSPSISQEHRVTDQNGLATLVLLLFSLVVDDVVELELIDALRGGDNTEPIAELHLLEELLGAASR